MDERHNTFPNTLLSFLIVEGERDKKFYERLTNPDKCRINTAEGKENVTKVLSILEQEKFPGALAIVDADFDVLEENVYPSANLFYTDDHDLEIMMIQAPSLDKFLAEYGSQDKIINFTEKFNNDIRSILIERTLPIGYLRWVSLREDLSFDFQELDFSKFVDKETLVIDSSKLVRILQERSPSRGNKKRNFTDNAIQIMVEQLKNNNHNRFHICCGHDVVELLSLGLRKALGSHNTRSLEPDYVEKNLRLAFEQVYFINTQLYNAIQEWEKVSKPFIVLRI